MQVEKADRAVQTRYRLGAGADLGAAGANQKRRRILRGRRIAGDLRRGHAARIVAVIAHASGDEQFGLVEGTERHGEFRAADRGLRIAGVRRLQIEFTDAQK